MFLRESRHKRASGEIVTYLQLAENVWNRDTQKTETRIVFNFGRADDPQVRERLSKLARGIMRRVAPEDLAHGNPGWKLLDAWPYGDVYVLEQLWAKIGLPELLPGLARDDTRRKLGVISPESATEQLPLGRRPAALAVCSGALLTMPVS